MTNQILFDKLGISVTVNRAAFSLFGIPIYWYGILIVSGIVIGVLYGLHECKKTGIRQDDLLNLLLLSVPVGIVCARAYYVIFSWDSFRNDLPSILNIRSGGLAIYGGIIGVCVVILVYCRRKKISVGKVLDILAVGLLIGQAIGRWGNFVNGEAFGGPTTLPWAMTVIQDGVRIANGVHPTFLYESLWNLAGIGVLLLYKKYFRKFYGELFCTYLIWYGLGRAWIEGLRADSLYIGAFRVSQILAVVCVLAGVCILIVGRKKAKTVKGSR